MNTKRTVFFDCTATLFSGLNTGIQRVVRNIIRRQNIMEKEFNINVVPIVSVMGNFYEVNPEVILDTKPITTSVGTRIRTIFDKIKRRLLTRIPWPKFILPIVTSLLNFTEWVLKRIFWLIKFLRVIKTVFGAMSPSVKVNSNDIVVLLDAFWPFDLSRSLSKIKAYDVVTVMYDLVPVYHGEFVEEVNRNLFLKALPWALHSSHRFLCISGEVESQLRKFCYSQGIENKGFSHFVLGSDFSPKQSLEEVRPEWNEMFEGCDVWLVVGTIEPRKNHQMALDAFDLHWKNKGTEKLLIIGRIGWKCEELVDRILNHPEYNKKLFFKWDSNDAELQAAYQKSAGLIFCSFAEGFGLPLVESMASQIKVICSEIPIFREIGGEYPIYFNLDHPQNLVDALIKAKSLPKPKAVKWASWDDSVRDFISKILQIEKPQ